MNRAKIVFGDKFGDWGDAVSFCPRARQIDETTLPKLRRELAEETFNANNKQPIMDAMAHLKGANYSSYVRPYMKDLAFGARSLLEKTIHASQPYSL